MLPVTHGQLLDAKYLLGLISLVGIGADDAYVALKDSFPGVIPISQGSSECLVIYTGSRIIIVYQGTKDATDLLRDIDIPKIRVSGGRVHRGFAEAYRQIEDRMLSAVSSLNPDRVIPVHVTGHSLGGAMALQSIVALKSRGHLVTDSIIFGCPRVGDAAWAETFNSLGVQVVHFLHNLDIVPALPPFLGYKAVGTSVYIDDAGNMWTKRKLSIKLLMVAWWAWIFRIPEAHLLKGYIPAISAAITRNRL